MNLFYTIFRKNFIKSMNEVEDIEGKLIHINISSINEAQIFVSSFLSRQKNYIIFLRLFFSSCIAVPEKIDILCSLFKNIIESKCIENSEYFYTLFIDQVKTQFCKPTETKFALNFMIENKMIPSDTIEAIREFLIYKYEEYLAIDGKKILISHLFHHNRIQEGKSPSLIVKYIRNDDLDSLSQFLNNDATIEIDKFLIEKNPYERCECIFEKKCKLIDCSAFFGSIKCFKYLYNISTITSSTFNFAIMGGNIEIIHLIENKFDDISELIKKESYYSLKCAIKYHRTSIFEWLLNIVIPLEFDTLQNLILFCCLFSNYQILNRFLIHKMDFSTLNQVYIDNIYDWIVTYTFFKIKRETLSDQTICAKYKNVIIQMFFNLIHNKELECLKIIVTNSPFIGELSCSQFIDIIMKCYENENIEIIKYLLNSQIFDINMKNKLRRPDHFSYLKYVNQTKSLLLFSCDSNLQEIIKLLLDIESIDVNSECEDEVFKKRNCFDSCCENCDKNILELFLTKFSKKLIIHLPLHFACRGDKLDNFQYLMSKINIDINKVDHMDRTCLHYACEINNVKFVKEILSIPNVIYDSKDKNQNSPFFIALKNSSIECLKCLLSFNNSSLININETDIDNNDSPLHIACKLNNIEIIKLILPNQKIDINIQNKEGIYIYICLIILLF